MINDRRETTAQAAARVARLYYFQNMTTAAIAKEMATSRATVSRLLTFAMDNGLVEIRVHDPNEASSSLAALIRQRFRLRSTQVVPTPPHAGEQEKLQRVAAQAAAYLNTLVVPSSVIGLAWGNTVAAIADRLVPKQVHVAGVVQLNGSGTGADIVNTFGESIVSRFAQNFGARAHSFPVPAFFDYPDTRSALWRERSIQSVRALQDKATIVLFSIGTMQANSYIHTAGYLDKREVVALRKDNVIGDIATVFFRRDGSWRDIPLNARSSGPDLDRFQRAAHAICVVSGHGKVPALLAALQGGFITELIVDEPSARLLLEGDTTPTKGVNRRTKGSR